MQHLGDITKISGYDVPAVDVEQLSLFSDVPEESDFPCNDCVFNAKNCCNHITDEECFCVMGSFRIRHSQVVCPQCGKTMDVRQSDFGNDYAVCICGLTKSFKNRGNRPTAFELYMGESRG